MNFKAKQSERILKQNNPNVLQTKTVGTNFDPKQS